MLGSLFLQIKKLTNLNRLGIKSLYSAIEINSSHSTILLLPYYCYYQKLSDTNALSYPS